MEGRKVTVLGTGSMGGAMARRLTGRGFDVVLYNRTVERAAAVAAATGARVATSPAAAAAETGIIVSSLADRDAVEQVYLGPEGALAALRPGAILLEASTVEPDVVRRLAGAAPVGVGVLDTPVSGSVAGAESGALTVMAGGDAAHLAAARPVLDALAAQVFHLGALGAGAAMKLAVNAVIHTLNAGLAEGVVLAEAAGIDRATAYDVIAAGAAGAPFVHYKRAAFVDPDGAAVAFRLALVGKDLDLILAMAGDLGVALPTTASTRHLVRAAVAAGLDEADMAALAVHLRRDAAATLQTGRS